MATLYEELHELQRENRRLRASNTWLRKSRDRWKNEAKAWQWGYDTLARKLSTRSTALSPTKRAEAS